MSRVASRLASHPPPVVRKIERQRAGDPGFRTLVLQRIATGLGARCNDAARNALHLHDAPAPGVLFDVDPARLRAAFGEDRGARARDSPTRARLDRNERSSDARWNQRGVEHVAVELFFFADRI